MTKILVVFTGGTIGSRIQDFIIDVDAEAGYYLLDSFQEKYNYEVEFDTIQPMNILSENSTPSHWSKLYNALNQVDRRKYDGIIITHGSDTLSYSSALLSYLFAHTEIPIVITASNYALECVKSNGMDNFKSSVDFIMNAVTPGVFTVYQNDKAQNIVYLSSRIMEADHYLDQFQSFGGAYFGEIIDGRFIPYEDRINPLLDKVKEQRPKLLNKDLTFDHQVLAMRVYPGLDYDFIDLSKKPKAILHSLYHSGTGCTGDLGYSLPKFVKRCHEEGIDTYLISFKCIDSDLYKTSRDILEYGAKPLNNISYEAAYTKLCIAYNQTEMPPYEYMKKELFFEYLPR